ncbi:hypothetical protein GCM10023146_41210 [Nocardioides caricicola]
MVPEPPLEHAVSRPENVARAAAAATPRRTAMKVLLPVVTVTLSRGTPVEVARIRRGRPGAVAVGYCERAHLYYGSSGTYLPVKELFTHGYSQVRRGAALVSRH